MNRSVVDRRRPAVIAVVCLALFVDSVLYSVAVPVLPAYARDLGASEAAIGVLFGSYAVGLLLASPAAGLLSDRLGRRLPLVVGSFGIAAATVMFAVSDSYWPLVAARLVQGVAAAVVWTAGVALVADLVAPASIGVAMGAVMAATSLGLIVGPPLGGVLAAGFGPAAPFLATAAVAAVNGVVQVVVLPATVVRRARGSGLTRVLRDRDGAAAAAAVVLGAGALTLLEPTLPLDLSARFGAGVAAIGIAVGVATLVHSAAALGAGHLAARVPTRTSVGAGLLVLGALLPTLALAGSFGVAVLLLAAFAAALAFVVVPVLPELARVVDRLGTGNGGGYALFNGAYAVGMLLGPLAGGAGLAVAGTGTVYAAAGALVAAGGLVVLVTGVAVSPIPTVQKGSY
jgi:multidrug resistance protein